MTRSSFIIVLFLSALYCVALGFIVWTSRPVPSEPMGVPIAEALVPRELLSDQAFASRVFPAGIPVLPFPGSGRANPFATATLRITPSAFAAVTSTPP